jgi:lipopolysaccharide heptosyltransferase II
MASTKKTPRVLPVIQAASDAAYDVRPTFGERLASRAGRTAKPRVQRALRLLIGTAGLLTRTTAEGPELTAGNGEIRRILVIRVDLIGDVVLSLPAVRALKRAYPEAEIDFLALKSSAGILANEPEIARVLTFDPYFWRRRLGMLNPRAWREAGAFLRELRDRRYDLAVSVSGDIASILARLSGATRRVGYAEEAYPHLLTDPAPGGRYRSRTHEVRYVVALAEEAGAVVTPSDARLSLRVDRASEDRVAAMVAQARNSSGRRGPVVTIHAGARNGQAKRWPTSHIAALATRLARELDALVLLTGAPGEASLAEAVERQSGGNVVDLCGKTSLPELAALLAASDLVISGDSGPMHIACAVGTPVVALHGPTDPAISGPTDPSASVLRVPLWCSPCYDASATAECRFGNPVCMKSLAPDVVYLAARRQLGVSRVGPTSARSEAIAGATRR